MILAFGFLTPWLLVGAAAMAIPFVLHLLSSVQAKDMPFPTLRFLKMSMEKTARRRRVQHWLLLLIRAGLLLLLAIAVAEPITQAFGGWMGKNKQAIAVVLDNSYSMGAKAGNDTRLDQAKLHAQNLLTGETPPESGVVLTTNGISPISEMTSDWAALGRAVRDTPLSGGRAPLLQKIRQAAQLLADHDTVSQKSIYVFSDLQRVSFEEIAAAEALMAKKDIHVMIVNTAPQTGQNIGISNLEVGGRRIVNSVVETTATVVNSCPGDREVMVGLRLQGKITGTPRRITLAGAGKDGSVATVRFLTSAGSIAGGRTGDVFLCDEQSEPFKDDLELDNVRRFCMTVGGRAKALILRGRVADGATVASDASTLLRIATDPWEGRADAPWSISPKLMDATDFKPQDLVGVDALFATNVPAFTTVQAAAVSEFVSRGGTVMLFLGPDVDAGAYNKAFGSILPGKILQPVGQVGPDAEAVGVSAVDIADPYLKGLFKERSDYLSPLVRRYFRMDRTGRGSTVLMGLANRDPLMLTKRIGRGRFTVCATAASGQWSNFLGSGANVIVSMVIRACLLAPQNAEAMDSYLWGAQVSIQPKDPKQGKVRVTLPMKQGSKQETVTLDLNARGRATFTGTRRIGVYHWRVTGPDADDPGNRGSFAVNPSGDEADLKGYSTPGFRRVLEKAGLEKVYVGSTLKEVMESAVADAQPAEWWDVVCIVVILLLIVEALVANRSEKTTAPSRGESHIHAT
ncbi:MAG: BatA and WFA domain-containing protein [Phycisphaerae bacterium]|jgi:hypothetical protein|nr:BatA and WFA domain-containing protein [Phycisphaerae bacterium]